MSGDGQTEEGIGQDLQDFQDGQDFFLTLPFTPE
jgi:hypothetical protein